MEGRSSSPATLARPDGSMVVTRALQLLETIAASERPLALPELCALLELPKATTHRLCQQLERGGYLAREPGGRRYTPGARLLRVGFNVLRSGLTAERHQILTALVDAIGETCNFTTLAGQEVIYLDRVESRWPLRLHFEIGSHVPIHCTASGKILLAAMKPAERRRIVDAVGLPALEQLGPDSFFGLRQRAADGRLRDVQLARGASGGATGRERQCQLQIADFELGTGRGRFDAFHA